ncbi:ComEC/Rec2 family competence protein [Candidatus Dependentiae bacterium]|nr:ComEC/Rec2 family competence protein [Candidatus Dependentiae bacterium]
MVNQNLQIQIPLTRIFLICSIYSIISSFLILHKLFIISITLSCIIFILSFLYCRNILFGTICIISSFFIFLRIQQKEFCHNSNIDFLNKEVIAKGTIQSIQHNLQDKKTTTILLKDLIVYNKELGSLSINKTILLQLPYKRSKRLELGRCIKFFKIKLTQPLPESPYHTYLIKENIWATSYISSENFYILKKSYITWYQQYFVQLSNYFESKTSHLYNPLFLGKKEKDPLSLSIQHQSLYWGIAHHMARSGIHLITILGLFVAIFHYLRLFHRYRFFIYGILVLLYAYISITSISFIRSLLMILFQMFAKFNGFIYSSIHAFLLTTTIVVFYNPFCVLFLDFQLSFGITAVIIWLFYIKWHKIIAFQIPLFLNS